MLLTPEEASNFWCPMTRNGGEPGCNRLDSTQCISSECMMWRWFDTVFHGAFRAAELGEPKPLRRGYCGLAGRPVA